MSGPDIAVALTIAGSDSGGGAGIQADLRTFNALDVFGTSAITCITAQNPDGVSHIQAVEAEVVRGQIERVLEGFPVAAIKTGMLYSVDIISTVASALSNIGHTPLIVDPVMIASSGACLLQADAIDALKADVFPLAALLTPNIPEAELLLGQSLDDVGGQSCMALALSETFGIPCVVKGGHLNATRLVDVLCVDGRCVEFVFDRAACHSSHGTGCTFAAALAASLAQGDSLENAVARARNYVKHCLERARSAGAHQVMGWGTDSSD